MKLFQKSQFITFIYNLKSKVTCLNKILIITIIIHIPTLFKGLNENNGFRQTQTALGIKYYVRENLNFLNATLPIAGPQSQIPMEFPLFQILASIPARIFNDFDFAARLTGLITFIVSIYFFWLLSQRLFGPEVSKYTTLLYALSPLALQWGASSMIEYLAVTLTLASILFLINFLSNGGYFNIFIFFLSLTLASLVKITTLVPWLFLICFFVIKEFSTTRTYCILTSMTLSFLTYIFWLNWSDNIKANGEWWVPSLTSDALRNWNFGTVALRLDLKYVFQILEKITGPTVGGLSVLILLLLYGIVLSRYQVAHIGLILVVLSGPIIFLPLYNHNYYAVAISPALALLAGSALFDIFSTKQTRSIVVSFLILSAYLSKTGLEYAVNYFSYPSPSQISQDIIKYTLPDEVIMVRCADDWSSEYLYYGDRRGLMLRIPDIVPNEDEWGTVYQYLAFCSEQDVDFSIVPQNINTKKLTPYLYRIN